MGAAAPRWRNNANEGHAPTGGAADPWPLLRWDAIPRQAGHRHRPGYAGTACPGMRGRPRHAPSHTRCHTVHRMEGSHTGGYRG